MIATLTALVLFAAPLELAPASAIPVALVAPLAQERTVTVNKEETREGIWKTLLLFGVSLVFILLGLYAIYRLREYLKEADIIK